MPRIAKIKVELITSLPSDPVSRQRLKDSVKEVVDLKRQIKDLQEQIKDIRDVEKQSHNIAPKYFNSLVKREYDVQYGAEKKTAALEAEQEVFTEADILMGRSSANNIVHEDEDEPNTEEFDGEEAAE